MATSVTDFKIASLAAGFTLGFGLLSVWKAIKHTRRAKYPWRSVFLWMVWGEIAANLGIGILGWVFLEGLVPPSVPVLFGLLFFWVFEIQLLMQIIINRIYVVAENRQWVVKVKWGTAIIITCINIMVFNIWIPAHRVPPVSETYVMVNKYWDPTSKVLICLVDAALNVWFVRMVRQRLVRYHGLAKYAALVRFNSYLMVISVCMDVMLIGLMFLKNQLVYVQFHPVTYIVKLNIELSMAALIAKLARQSSNPNISEVANNVSSSYGNSGGTNGSIHMSANRSANLSSHHNSTPAYPMKVLKQQPQAKAARPVRTGSIHTTTDIFVHSEEMQTSTPPGHQRSQSYDVENGTAPENYDTVWFR